jgi:hypothetical protein
MNMKVINFVLFHMYLFWWRLQVNLFGKGAVVRPMPARHGCQEPLLVNSAASSIVAAWMSTIASRSWQ